MATQRLKRQVACLTRTLLQEGGPTLFLFALCLSLGTFFLYLGASIGIALILAGSAALALFLLLGWRQPCREGPI